MLGPVVVDVQGTRLTEAEREMLEHPLVGMVILFGRNFESAEQLRLLTNEIHAVRNPRLLIAVDHEGGRVQRFRSGFTRLPAMRRLGELWDRDVLAACRAALSTGLVLATELRACGVDL
ncbi:MAG: glycoside hydrolase family 3 N-terminal domain-containing protein, partial [Betaproteobacteria bacterium]